MNFRAHGGLDATVLKLKMWCLMPLGAASTRGDHMSYAPWVSQAIPTESELEALAAAPLADP
eukprot:3940603-Alexandrium_andersonii.AAC.1